MRIRSRFGIRTRMRRDRLPLRNGQPGIWVTYQLWVICSGTLKTAIVLEGGSSFRWNHMSMKTLLAVGVLLCAAQVAARGQSAGTQAQPQPVPAVDGGLGPCSVEFTTADGNGNVIGGATLRLHLAYGFAGVRRLDLEVTTNTDGKARFTGLPDNLKKGLFFRGFKDEREGTAFYEPKKNCQGKHTMVLEKPPTPSPQ
jgi:hypothetical protein